MSDASISGSARYTSLPAAKTADEHGVSTQALSSLTGIFSIGQDTLRLLSPSREPFVRRLMPARPATQANHPGFVVFADGD